MNLESISLMIGGNKMKTNFKKTLCALISVTFIFNIMSVVPAAAEQVNIELTESVSVSQDDLPSSDKLLSEYIKRKSLNELYRVQPLSTTQAGDNLPAGSVMRNIYDDLKARIIAIASGTASDSQFTINDLPSLSWTAAELGVPQIIENGKITQQAMQAAAGKLEEEIDISRLLSALTADCPFELFWFDKVEGMVVSYSISADSTTFRIPSINFSFPVAYDYRGSDEYHVNESKVTKANAAAKNAAMVVEENEGLSDREKLEAYKDTICDLTDYNYDAAESTSDDYGDVWQMIYVFDNDSSTKVVCEGYSKAFQYLCDLSDFSTDVRCYSAAGLVYTEDSAYGHMWNVVRLDGRYYLADVTNCDDDYGRDYSGPFLVCAVENAPDFSMCLVDLFGEEAVYQYDADQKDLYVKGYLPLGVHEYEPKMGEDPTCTKQGHIVYGCDLCGDTYTEDLPPTGHKYKTTVKKATTSKNGSIVKTCDCGAKTTTPVYYPKTFKLSTTSYTYDGKVKKPAVTVKDSAGKTISSANYTVTYASGRQYVGKYAVKVTFKGNYSGSKMLYFNINPRNTSISKLTSGRKSFKVYLKKYTTQTTGYQIQYSTSSKFTGAKTVTVSNKTTAKTISKLYGGKRYYVRCRTYKKVGKTNFFSSWSGAKAVTTKK